MDVMAVPEVQAHTVCGRASSCSYVWRPAAAPKAEASVKVSPLTLAWRTGSTALRKLQTHYSGNAWNHGATLALRLLSRTSQRILSEVRRGAWFSWLQQVCMALHGEESCSRTQLIQLGAFAAVSALAVAKQDATAAVTGYRKWLHDGPAAGLGRQHRYTRTSTGWLPSTLLSSSAAEDDDYSRECDGLADPSDGKAQLAGIAEAMAPTAQARTASLQEEAENEALKWGAQWLRSAEYDMSWLSDLGDALPPLDEKRLIGALRSFPAGTGLGWDRMHPRAWLRFGSAALHSLLHFFMLVEREGRWPDAKGHVVIVLLAKATGGFRPIGLFLSIVRV